VRRPLRAPDACAWTEPATDRYFKTTAERRRYLSDLSDARWELVEPVLTAWRAERRGRGLDIGRPPDHDLRSLLDTILYVNRTGIPWRYLRHDYPHWNTAYAYLARRQESNWSTNAVTEGERSQGERRRRSDGLVVAAGRRRGSRGTTATRTDARDGLAEFSAHHGQQADPRIPGGVIGLRSVPTMRVHAREEPQPTRGWGSSRR
jgi:transposase